MDTFWMSITLRVIRILGEKWNSLNLTKHICKELAVLTSLWSFQRWNKFTSSFEYIVMFWWEDISFDMGIDFKQDTWKLKCIIVIPTYGRGKFQHKSWKPSILLNLTNQGCFRIFSISWILYQTCTFCLEHTNNAKDCVSKNYQKCSQ